MSVNPDTTRIGLPTPATPSRMTRWLLPVAAGTAVAVALGVYGSVHEPTGFGVLAGFSDTLAVKTLLATVAIVLAMVQLGSATVMYGKIRGVAGPPWIGVLHRWSGRIAVLISVPVAVHCLYALGLQYGSTRVLVHSLLGCLFYGVFVTKMLLLTRRGLPGWVLPLVGGLVFTTLVVIWLASAVWVFATQGVQF